MAPLPPIGNRGSEDRAQVYTIGAARAIAVVFPQIRSIGMWRPPDGFNEHSSGMAADVMIPNWNTPQGKALGDEVCKYALTLQGVDYVIWLQAMHYRDGRVTPMSNRGSPTQNHMDHNHVHTTGGGYPGPGHVYEAPGTRPTTGGRYWPLGAGRQVTSPFGPRGSGFHAGVDFGRDGGSAGMPVFACQGGEVINSGAASGYGGPDPAGWLVIDHSDADGAGCTEYGHIIREVAKGQRVEAGQRIGHINPDQLTNGGVAPHLHLALMPREYNPGAKIDPLPWLAGAREPGGAAPPPVPPPPAEDGAVVLSKAMGGSVSLDRYRELLPGFRDCVLRCKADQPKRINMLVAQLGHESGGLKYMEEIADGSAYEGRGDLGNTQPGDGKRFKGRGPIQITGRHNYTKLSQWAHGQGFVPTPTFFVDQPTQLASPQYGFLGAVWYWTVARPKINEYCDWDDLEASLVAVTKAINGGTNGLTDRRNRLNRARSMDLAPIMRDAPTPPPPPGEDELSAEAERMIRELHDAYMGDVPSLSPLRHLGEGKIGPVHRILRNIDGSGHVEIVTLLASLNHKPSLDLLYEIAAADPARYPDRQSDRELAQAILADVVNKPAETTATLTPNTSAPTFVAPPVVSPVVEPESMGKTIGDMYSALESLRLDEDLPPEARAPLTALIAVLQTKTNRNAE